MFPDFSVDQPFWYQRALDVPSAQGWVDVDGIPIRFMTWGKEGLPGVVLIHGSNAHLEWWRFVAPFLADQIRVAAIDLSGNGDSGWRDRYSGEGFAREVWAVCKAAKLGPRPVVVGHSFGGFVALETAHHFSREMAGLVLMDFTIAAPEQYVEWGLRAEREGVVAKRKLRVYATRDEILARFRLIPEQPGVHPLVLRHMGEAGIKAVEGGFTWKFDPSLFDHLEMGIDQRDKFVSLQCRSAVILGEQSTDEGALFGPYMSGITGGHLPIFIVPGTYHHLMFDDPISVSMSLKALMLQWLGEDHRTEMKNNLEQLLEKRRG